MGDELDLQDRRWPRELALPGEFERVRHEQLLSIEGKWAGSASSTPSSRAGLPCAATARCSRGAAVAATVRGSSRGTRRSWP
jgi:hypothetical protein